MISSAANPLIKRVKKLLTDSAFRSEEREFVIEGMKIIHDALIPLSARQSSLVAILCTRKAASHPHINEMMRSASSHNVPLIEISDTLMSRMSSLKTDQGIIAVSRFLDKPPQEILNWKKNAREELLSHFPAAKIFPFYVGACQIQEPGNLGALMRTAHAGAANGLLIFEGSADAYNPKTVRGSAGAILSIPFARNLQGLEILPEVKRLGIAIYSTSSFGSLHHTEADFDRPTLVLFGGEGGGIPGDYLRFIDGTISIPMFGGIESLNVNASAAIIIYERLRRLPDR